MSRPPVPYPGRIVIVSDLPEPNKIVNNWSSDHQDALHERYMVLPRYFGDMGRIQMPVSGLPTTAQVGPSGSGAAPVPCEVVQVSAPWMRVTIGWVGQRYGIPPTVPDPRPPTLATNYVLLRYVIFPPSPPLGADGITYLWSCGGVYSYALKVPFTPDDGFQAGAMPYQTIPAGLMIFGATNFVKTIFQLF